MFNRQQKTVLTLLFFIHFLMIVDFMVIMPMAPHLMNLFGVSASALSLLVTTFTLAAGLMGLISSLWMDRFDRKKTLLLVVLGFLIGNTACALSQGYWGFVIARGFTGAFVGVIGSLMLAILSDSIPQQTRGTAIGIVMSAFALASIVGVPFCLFLYQKLSWSAPFWFLAFGTLVFLLLAQRLLPNYTSHLASTVKSKLLTTNEQKTSILFIVLLVLGHFSINPFLFVSLIQNAQIPEKNLMVIYFCAGMGSIVSSLVSGYLVDKKGFRSVFLVSLILSLLPIYWVTSVTPENLTTATLGVTAFFILMGARMTAAMTWTTAKSQLESRGSFLSLVNSFQHLAAAFAALISGQIVEKANDGSIQYFDRVGLMAIVFSLLALYIPLKTESRPAIVKL